MDMVLGALVNKKLPAEKIMFFGFCKEVHNAESTRSREEKWKLFWFQEKNGPITVLLERLLRATDIRGR